MESGTIRNLSKVQKIALWIALLWLLFCFLGSFGEGWYILIVVCIVLFATIFCLFKGKLDAKYAWATFAVSLILPFFMIGFLVDSGKGEAKNSIEKKEEQKAASVVKEQKKSEVAEEEKPKEAELSSKEKEFADAGYKKGTLYGMAGANNNEFSDMLDMADKVAGMEDKVNDVMEEMAGRVYDTEYDAPSNAEQEKLKKIYIENFIKGMNDTMDAMNR